MSSSPDSPGTPPVPADPEPGAHDREADSLFGRARRIAQVGGTVANAGLSFGVNRLFSGEKGDARFAAALRDALGRTRGPMMKLAQMLATIPDLLPPEYAEALQKLQAHAPAMGFAFVNRRMRAELGAEWAGRFATFGREAAFAASLGQVHRATAHDGTRLAVKLQYPDMASAVEADIAQLRTLMTLLRALDGTIDPSAAVSELADRLREELDYRREARAQLLYRTLLDGEPDIMAPTPRPDLSTARLLSMTWLDGASVLDFKAANSGLRNAIAHKLFRAWWRPMMGAGVIHGDPHPGNYTFDAANDRLNLLDFGCIRIFPPEFVGGIVALYRALLANDRDAQRAAYRIWGFPELTDEGVEILSLWARFIFAPLLDDRVRTIADGVPPGEYGRKEAFALKKRLRDIGPIAIPREFVFMDRAAIGLGSVFLHLGAELNFHRLFEDSLAGFSIPVLAERQKAALATAGLAA